MKIVVIVGILILIVAGFFFIYNQGEITGSTITGGSVIDSERESEKNEDTRANVPAAETLEITIDASRFAFDPSVIKVKEGERVKIIVQNTDTTHGISIPDFNVRGKESVEFVATKKGSYKFYCGTYCGSGHPTMQGTFIVE